MPELDDDTYLAVDYGTLCDALGATTILSYSDVEIAPMENSEHMQISSDAIIKGSPLFHGGIFSSPAPPLTGWNFA